MNNNDTNDNNNNNNNNNNNDTNEINDYYSSTTDSSTSPHNSKQIHIDINHDSNNIELGQIQEENNLIDYTNTHFTNIANNDLHKIRNELNYTNDFCLNYIQTNFTRCDSPVTISYHGSRNGSTSNSDIEDDTPPSNPSLSKQISLEDISQFKDLFQQNTSHKSKTNKPTQKRYSKFKQLAFHDVEKTLDKYYDMELDNKFSSELDILTTFMKGQKNLYIQSNYLSQWRFNCLMIPSLLITASITILSPAFPCDSIHSWLISGLNAVIALLISIMNYFKLESSTQLYLQLANHYDKLETSLEMANSKLLLMDTDTEKRSLVLNEIQIIEQKIKEMKEVNNIFIPAEIKNIFPIICHVNIFSFIKKLENHRHILILKFEDIKNEIRFILHKWNKDENEFIQTIPHHILQQKNTEKLREQKRLTYLYEVKEKLKAELNEYRSAYSNMDDIFTHEIKHAEMQTNQFGIWIFCLWKKNYHINLKNINPVLDKYFHFLFIDE